jgi:hypothetical protein
MKMSPETVLVGKFLDGVLNLLTLGGQQKLRRNQEYDEALRAIKNALIETKLYLADYRRTNVENRETEKMLARLWIDAGVAIRKYDRGFAERCFSKSEYWTNPADWDSTQIREAGIKIERIDEYFRQLALENP